MKKHCKFSEEKFEKSLWSVSKLVCWTLSLLLGVLLFATVPWAVVIVGLLGISFFIDMKIEENDEEDGTSMQSNGEGCGRCKQDGQIRFCSHKCPFASPPEGEEGDVNRG